MEREAQQLKRIEILRVAAQHFAEKGYESANINDIAIHSGLGKGTIYLYFKNKKELYISTIRSIVEEFNDATEQLMSTKLSPFEKLMVCVKNFFTIETEQLPFLVLWSRHQYQGSPVFQEEVKEVFENLRQPLCEIIEEGVSVGVFQTDYPKVTGFLLLSSVLTLMPSLQPSNELQLENYERIEIIEDAARKLLCINLHKNNKMD